MNRTIVQGVACTAALSLALTACGDGGGGDNGGNGGETLSLSLGHSYGVDSLQNRAAQELAERVAERTDDRLEISVYPASQLGSWEEMQEGLEVGSVDIVIESVGSLERYTDLAAIEGIPFLYTDEDHFFEVWDGELGEEIVEAIREDSGFLLLGDMYRGPRVLNSTRPVEELADLSGLRLRVPTQQTYIDTWEALGASPTPLALNEVFSAIEQGAIEGQENPIDVVRFNSFYEVAPYVTNTNHLYGNFHFQVWGDTYDSWDEELREILDEEIAEISAWYRDQSIEEQEDNISYLEGEGVEFYEINYDEWLAPTEHIADDADPQVQDWVDQILN